MRDDSNLSDDARRTLISGFVENLRELRASAGQPSLRTMARVSGAISHTTLYEAERCVRLPSWHATREYVRGCGGDVEQWHSRWNLASTALTAPAPVPVARELPADEVAMRPCSEPQLTPEAPIAPSEPVPHPAIQASLRRVLSYFIAATLGGILTGAMMVLMGSHSGSSNVAEILLADCPYAAANRQIYSSHATKSPARLPVERAVPTWVARTDSDAQILNGSDSVLAVVNPVQAGEAFIVTVVLTNACPGSGDVTDTRNDRFQVVADMTGTVPSGRVCGSAPDRRTGTNGPRAGAGATAGSGSRSRSRTTVAGSTSAGTCDSVDRADSTPPTCCRAITHSWESPLGRRAYLRPAPPIRAPQHPRRDTRRPPPCAASTPYRFRMASQSVSCGFVGRSAGSVVLVDQSGDGLSALDPGWCGMTLASSSGASWPRL